MKKFGLMVCLIATTMVLATSESNAQFALYNGFDSEGLTTANQRRFVTPGRTLRRAARDHFSPHPVYAYSSHGIDAGLTHQWNESEALSRPWHTGYGHWRYDEPTALVVPPTASYQMKYSWGVGQNRSVPIHHQYGRAGAGMMGGGAGTSQRTPYFPSHSDQTGVYSVRAPW